MKRLLAVLLLILAFVFAKASGQAPACPTIEVTGPAGITQPDDAGEFKGTLSGDIPVDVKYSWMISNGEVLRGQGTLRLTVKWPKSPGSNVTATLEVLGLPTGCSNHASASAPICVCGDPILVDEFGSLRRRDQMARIDAAVAELGKYPSSKLVIIEFFPNRSTQTTIDRRKKWLSNQLSGRHTLRSSVFEIITSVSVDGDSLTKIYIVPQGAADPQP